MIKSSISGFAATLLVAAVAATPAFAAGGSGSGGGVGSATGVGVGVGNGNTPSAAYPPTLSMDQAAADLQSQGYTGVGKLAFENNEYVGQAMHNGQSVTVHVNAANGAITN